MSRIPFSFGNAISHYSKTGGPGGFLWKFALAYAVVTCVLQAVSIWLQWPLYEVYLRMITDSGGDFEAYADEIGRVSGTTSLRALLIMPVGLLVWMMFEAANQRRYMRAEGFSLRLGGDEWRLLVIGIIWVVTLFVMYFGFAFTIVIPVALGLALGSKGATIALLLGIVLVTVYLIFMLWAVARLSAASALTVRDRRIRFFESWKVTKGKGWTILGTWIVLGLIAMVAGIVFYLIAAAVGFGLVAAQVPDFTDDAAGAAIMSALASPAFWGPMLLVAFVYIMLGAMFMHIYSGPAALAARTDSDWSGDVAGEFQ